MPLKKLKLCSHSMVMTALYLRRFRVYQKTSRRHTTELSVAEEETTVVASAVAMVVKGVDEDNMKGATMTDMKVVEARDTTSHLSWVAMVAQITADEKTIMT